MFPVQLSQVRPSRQENHSVEHGNYSEPRKDCSATEGSYDVKSEPIKRGRAPRFWTAPRCQNNEPRYVTEQTPASSS